MPRPLYTELRAYIEDLINRNFIVKSQSAYSSPVVAVRLKNGELRLCCDFRELNKRTIPDKHPLPRVQDAIDGLCGKSWFSLLDQSRAYHQGFIHSESRPYTAFATPFGLYEWVRIPFGLCNAPAQFQRYMETCIDGIDGDFVMPYLDDLLVFSSSFEDHVKHVQSVLQRLKAHGIKLKASKCQLFKRQVTYLGRVITKDGYRMDPGNISAVMKLKSEIPKTVGDLRRVLGLVGHFRRFVPNFAQKACVLFQLLEKQSSPAVSSTSKPNRKRNNQLPSSTSIRWTTEHQQALNLLLDAITQDPILAYPDFSLPFILHTDASQQGLGAVLYQKRDGKMHAVGYGSRTLSAAERNYHSSKLEFLALKWAITDKFRPYLFYSDGFEVYTDNNPLTYALSTAKVNSNGQRWVNELANFQFTIKYRRGAAHADADCLSRYPEQATDIDSFMQECKHSISLPEMSAIRDGLLAHQKGEDVIVSALNAQPVFAELEKQLFADVAVR